MSAASMNPITSLWISARAGRRPAFRSQGLQRVNRQTSDSRCHASSLSGGIRNGGVKAEMPNELMRIIVNHIKTHGPMPLPRYIGLCLGHPTLGYYTRSAERSSSALGDTAVIGKKGDFITSPEISQVFGELLAIWYITQWQAQGMPEHSRIIELGPGRGTLMDDMLRTFKSLGAFGKTLTDVHLVENSPYMKKLQERKLAHWQAQGLTIHWHDRIENVPVADEKTYTMVAAHEFFDALPIHMFEKRAEGWREVFVDLEKPQTAQEATSKILLPGQAPQASIVGAKKSTPPELPPKLRFVVSPSATLAANLLVREDDTRFKGLSEGTRVEVCPDLYGLGAAAARLVKPCGAGLVIDYGDNRFFNHSFRAFKDHKLVDPLQEPGSADLTSNVDFSALRDSLTSGYTGPGHTADHISDAFTSPPPATGNADIFVPPLLSQRSFLLSLGLQLRVEKLVQNAPDDQRRKAIIDAAQRLVDKNVKIHGMGKVFKVLGFVPSNKDVSETREVFPFGSELD